MPDDSGSPADVGMMREIDERIRSRMSVLEREIASLRSRSRLLGAGLVITIGLLAVVAAFPELLVTSGIRSANESLEVRRLVLVGESGNRRGEWAVDEEGSVRFSLLDPQGRARLNLSVLGGGFPGLSLSNAEGQRRAVLGMLPDETTTLVFADQAGTTRAVFGLTQANAASLLFADANAVTRIGFALDGDGTGSMVLPEEGEEPQPDDDEVGN